MPLPVPLPVPVPVTGFLKLPVLSWPRSQFAFLEIKFPFHYVGKNVADFGQVTGTVTVAHKVKVKTMSSKTLLEQNLFSIGKQYEQLAHLQQRLKSTKTHQERLEIISAFPEVKQFLGKFQTFEKYLHTLSPPRAFILLSIIAIGQGERVLSTHLQEIDTEKLAHLIDTLLPVEEFYRELGGLVGYHRMILHFLAEAHPKTACDLIYYHPPEGIDISQDELAVRRAVISGLKGMDQMAEIYPVGGAADRLRLQDEVTHVALPAAKLIFGGKTLLEGIILDLQAREYLHFKLFGKQIITPVAMMTSQEKDNHAQVLSICSGKNWFGRPKDSIRFFSQPSVPSVNRNGEWCLLGPMQLLLKPGGHGVIWKLARDAKIFDWLFAEGKKKALVRQINNPIAGIDYGLLAFTGLGCEGDKIFGFASCPRKLGAAEGINVLMERQSASGFEYTLTNIEYCDFEKYRLVEKEGRGQFSSNTNILFVDLKAVLEAVDKTPLPGLLINPKKTSYRTSDGLVEEEIARLESTMQNIADCFNESFSKPLKAGQRKEAMRTFLTFNSRNKTISTVKKEASCGTPIPETPAGCFIDAQKNARELFSYDCKMEVSEEEPLPLFFYHPALGPLYSLIAQKVRGGRIAKGSELSLEIAELDMENLDLHGSLLIHAHDLMGGLDELGVLRFSNKVGKCVLKDVKVKNAGIDLSRPSIFWKREIFRKESCQIILHGNGEFYAESVTLTGNLCFEVKNGERLTVKEERGKLIEKREKLACSKPLWHYAITDQFEVKIKR